MVLHRSIVPKNNDEESLIHTYQSPIKKALKEKQRKDQAHLHARCISLLFTLLASIIMHVPGLAVHLKYNRSTAKLIGAVLGTFSEGAFLLSLLALLTRLVLRRSNTCPRSTARQRILLTAPQVVGCVLSLVLCVTFILFSVSHMIYEDMSGGLSPDIWIVAAGISNAREHIGTQVSTSSMHLMNSIAKAIGYFIVGMIAHVVGQRNRNTVTLRQRLEETTCFALMAVIFYIFGAWSPALHIYLSILGSLCLSPEGSNVTIKMIDQHNRVQNRASPNIIYLLHESLAGPMLMVPEGRNATPFFHSLLKDERMYMFPHARSVSGNTVDCLTALLTGCVPTDDIGRSEIAYVRSLATEFRHQGYRTASFTSRSMNMQIGPWWMLHNFLSANMDVVIDPLLKEWTLTNGEGSDDRLMLPEFKKWILSGDIDKPFYAQFYLYNTHWPYQTSGNSTAQVRYFSALETLDEFLKRLFAFLEENQLHENTVIVGSGDHGDEPQRNPQMVSYARLYEYTPKILSPPVYFYVPNGLLDTTKCKQLRQNTNKVISILDIYPTIQTILYGGDAQETGWLRDEGEGAKVDSDFEKLHCLSGFDLLSSNIAEERVAYSWNIASNTLSPDGHVGLLGASNKMEGIFYRQGPGDNNGLFELDFGICLLNWKNKCSARLSIEGRKRWQTTFEAISKSVIPKSTVPLLQFLENELRSNMENGKDSTR